MPAQAGHRFPSPIDDGRDKLNGDRVECLQLGKLVRKQTSINYRNEAELVQNCPVAAAMKAIGGRWKIMIVWYVAHGFDRFGSLTGLIAGISDKMLYQQLRELERDGLLLRIVSGRHVSYRQTELARSLTPILAQLETWSRDHRMGERLAVSGGAG